MKRLLLACALLGCGASSSEVNAVAHTPDAGDAAPSDTAQPSTCDPHKPFGAPKKLSVNTAVYDQGGRLSVDELTLFFGSIRGESMDVFVATRPTRDAPFGPATAVTQVNGPYNEHDPMLSADGLRLFFARGFTSSIFYVSRSTPTSPRSAPKGVASVYTEHDTREPYLAYDGSELWFARARGRGGTHRLMVAKAEGEGFASPREVEELLIGDEMEMRAPVLSRDGLTLYFTWKHDIHFATRPARDAPFGAPKLVAELAGPSSDWPTWISPDDCRLYFASERDFENRGELYVAER